jgi:hypothetical protein
MLFYPFPLFSLPPPPAPVVVTVPDLPIPTRALAARDIRLTDSGDIYIANGDIWLVGELDAIVQECGTALRLWQGEYLLDDIAGAQWAVVLTKGVTNQELDAEIRRVLATVPGVVAVDNVAITRDTISRRAAIVATVLGDGGVVLTVTQEIEE